MDRAMPYIEVISDKIKYVLLLALLAGCADNGDLPDIGITRPKKDFCTEDRKTLEESIIKTCTVRFVDGRFLTRDTLEME